MAFFPENFDPIAPHTAVVGERIVCVGTIVAVAGTYDWIRTGDEQHPGIRVDEVVVKIPPALLGVEGDTLHVEVHVTFDGKLGIQAIVK